MASNALTATQGSFCVKHRLCEAPGSAVLRSWDPGLSGQSCSDISSGKEPQVSSPAAQSSPLLPNTARIFPLSLLLVFFNRVEKEEGRKQR